LFDLPFRLCHPTRGWSTGREPNGGGNPKRNTARLKARRADPNEKKKLFGRGSLFLGRLFLSLTLGIRSLLLDGSWLNNFFHHGFRIGLLAGGGESKRQQQAKYQHQRKN